MTGKELIKIDMDTGSILKLEKVYSSLLKQSGSSMYESMSPKSTGNSSTNTSVSPISSLFKSSSLTTSSVSKNYDTSSSSSSGSSSGNNSGTSTPNNKLHSLEKRISQIHSLIVFPTNPLVLHYINISIFSSLQELYIESCPPSTIAGLYELRHQLKVLEMSKSGIIELIQTLAPVAPEELLNEFKPIVLNDIKPTVPKELEWTKLRKLKLHTCGIDRLDQSMHFLPYVADMDLSNNDIGHIVHLHDCFNLKNLNMSHNRVRVLSNIGRVLGNVITLDVSHNNIESLDGVSCLYSLQYFNVSFNVLDDFNEVSHLSKLPCLEELLLEGNPFSEMADYRSQIFTQLLKEGTSSTRRLPRLDDADLSEKETHNLRGMMFKAPDNYQNETSFSPYNSPSGRRNNTSIVISGNAYINSDYSNNLIHGDLISALVYSDSNNRQTAATPTTTAIADDKGGTSSYSKSYDTEDQASKALDDRSFRNLLNVLTPVDILSLSNSSSNSSSSSSSSKTVTTDEFVSSYFNNIRSGRNNCKRRLACITDCHVPADFIDIGKLELNVFTYQARDAYAPSDWSALLEELKTTHHTQQQLLLAQKEEEMNIQAKAKTEVLIEPRYSTWVTDDSSNDNNDSNDDNNKRQFDSDCNFRCISSDLPIDKRMSQDCRSESFDRMSYSKDPSVYVKPSALSAEVSAVRKDVTVSPLLRDDVVSIDSGKNSRMTSVDFLLEQSLLQYNTAGKFTPDAFGYVGNEAYASYVIHDNLELYFHEQVFSVRRPSGEAPYICEGVAIASTTTTEAKSDGTNVAVEPLKSCLESRVVFVLPSKRQEKLAGIFTEKLIDLHPKNTDKSELSVILVLTDVTLYILLHNSINPNATFIDAPIPVLLRSHELYSLEKCTIFFGFQRCILNFNSNEKNEIVPVSMVSYSPDTVFVTNAIAENARVSYMIITRDKARAFPIITRIPQVANAARCLEDNRLGNVKISNKDAQLLDAILKATMGTDPDVVHYQMLFQCNPKGLNGYLPRTIILTSTLILLCDEDILDENVALKVFDRCDVRNIRRMRTEEDPLHFTITFKSQSLFAKSKKWRLRAETKAAVVNLQDQCRRVMSSLLGQTGGGGSKDTFIYI